MVTFENKIDLVNEQFDFCEEFGVKLIHQNSDFFKGEKNYKIEKKEDNIDTKEKYLLYLKQGISNVELIEILFSLQKELNLEKYDLLEDFIEKIKIKISLLLRSEKNNEKLDFIEEKLILEGLSKKTIEDIKNYKLKNSLFKYRNEIKKLKNKKNEELNKDKFLLDELYKTFYNTITHNGFEYQRNFSKNYTRKDFEDLIKKYNIDISDNIKYSEKKILPTLVKKDFFLENENFLKDLLKLDKVKDKIKELIKAKKITKEILFNFIKSVYLLVFQYPSIYDKSDNGDFCELEEPNFIDIVQKKQVMCLTKNTLLYGLLSGLDGIKISSNIEPHHISSNISFKDSNDKIYEYYLDSTLFLDLNKIEKINNTNGKNSYGKFEEKIILDKNGKEIKKIKTIKGKSKDILFSSYLSNLMNNILDKEDFGDKDFKNLENLFKYSIMSEKNNYISYRALGIGLRKISEKLEKEGKNDKANEKIEESIKNLKKTLEIYPLDYLAWKEIGKIIGGKNKIQYISFIIKDFNLYKLHKSSRKNLLKKETYNSFGISDKEFNEIISILDSGNFYKLLEFLIK